MLNVEEVICPELKLAVCNVKEAARMVLHTIVVCRSIGGVRPIEPKVVHSELFDCTYMKTDELEIDQELEQSVRNFAEIFETNLGTSGRAYLKLNLYATKSRKQSMWNLLVGGEEKVIFEQWCLPVAVQKMRRHVTPAENLREEAENQKLASKQVEEVLHFIISKANSKVDHLPPPPQTQASYRYDISFTSIDGKGLQSSPRSMLPQGFSHTLKHIPHIA
mmetsp:Transcript_83438/g.131807  ORF Transcript_83438/g.131807 Transcript_83438/m.131807 type:complete len:220 (-) Transcript_83438:117-776(-)